jgi:hypothetical protein
MGRLPALTAMVATYSEVTLDNHAAAKLVLAEVREARKSVELHHDVQKAPINRVRTIALDLEKQDVGAFKALETALGSRLLAFDAEVERQRKDSLHNQCQHVLVHHMALQALRHQHQLLDRLLLEHQHQPWHHQLQVHLVRHQHQHQHQHQLQHQDYLDQLAFRQQHPLPPQALLHCSSNNKMWLFRNRNAKHSASLPMKKFYPKVRLVVRSVVCVNSNCMGQMVF